MTGNCSISTERGVQHFEFIIYILIFIFGIVINTLALWVFCCKLKWTETTIYMTNLAFADFCLLFSLPFKLYAQNKEWDLGRELCTILKNIYYINMCISVYTITAIAMDRYIVIRFPLRVTTWRSPLKSAVVCGVIWVTVVSFCSFISFNVDGKNKTNNNCFQKTDTSPRQYTLPIFVIMFLIPLLLLLFCSIQIICSLQRKKAMNIQQEKLIKQAKCIIIINITAFIVCFLPLHVATLARYKFESMNSDDCNLINQANTLVRIFLCIANINCCTDAICYYFVAKEFREASRDLLRQSGDFL
nr:PREDICTED: G-protein coupled receptor 35-like isoform X2 [Latimeria chalumnae]|eukprot:XP_014353883.1 PREDICTED: G-protein coupled receptor 35-like isoform X2 [Latimeria chalumnae]